MPQPAVPGSERLSGISVELTAVAPMRPTFRVHDRTHDCRSTDILLVRTGRTWSMVWRSWRESALLRSFSPYLRWVSSAGPKGLATPR
jgi:hypothetical protein